MEILNEKPTSESKVNDNTRTRDGTFCPMCSKQFFNNSSLRRHLRMVHKADDVDLVLQAKQPASELNETVDQPVNASFCDLSSNIQKYQGLIKTDQSTKQYICEKCAIPFASSKQFLRHFHREHLKDFHGLSDSEINLFAKPAKKYICDECSKPFYSEIMFLQHFQHRDDLVCQKCPNPKKFRSKCSLANHLEYVHGLINESSDDQNKKKKEQKCSDCNKRFPTVYSLRNHFERFHMPVNGGAINLQEMAEMVQTISKKQEPTTVVTPILRIDNLDEHRCEKCNRTFKNRLKLMKHIHFYHMKIGDEPLKKCPFNDEILETK